MEKFSAYRDLGTGIQPFLTPIPPLETDILARVIVPLRYALGTLRTALILCFLAIYVVLVSGLCTILVPAPPLYRFVTCILTSIITRSVLLILGFVWIPTEQVRRKRGKVQSQMEAWIPEPGDIIVSNWVSWIEVLWLAFRFNPIFVLPLSEAIEIASVPNSSATVSHSPGRRMGTGSANVFTPRQAAIVPVSGFLPVSLLSMLRLTGRVPLAWQSIVTASPRSLEELRRSADRPIVVFPECTTSNGRGLLRFAKVFHEKVPVKKYRVFVMCVRYDPPTTMSPTLTLPIPSKWLNPLPHIFSVATSIFLPTVSIRLLVPSESPSSPIFLVNEVISHSIDGDADLTDVTAALITQIGKFKRIGMGWEDKASFFEFFSGKTGSSQYKTAMHS